MPRVDSRGVELDNAGFPIDRCTAYNRETGRWCRNKRFKDRRCKRHFLEALERFEAENPRLKWYLENRHLLTNEKSVLQSW